MGLSKKVLYVSAAQVQIDREKIINITNTHIEQLLSNGNCIDFLRDIKFRQCGYDPLFEHETNFIEQVNQTFTYLVCLSAVELLMKLHPEKRFIVNFGVESGYDVVSEDESIICECFASTTPDSNDKLKLDTIKVYNNQVANFKYVIFYTEIPKVIHTVNIKNKYPGVVVIALDYI